MLAFSFFKSIGRRVLRCYLLIVLYAVISALMCLIGQGLYLLVIQLAHLVTEPWLSRAAYVFRMIITLFAVAIFVTVSTISKWRLFWDVHRDINQYLCERCTRQMA